MHELANPVYYALADQQAAFGEHRGTARRFDPDVAPFTALPDEPTADDWDALRDLVTPTGMAFLLREPVAIPDTWQTLWEIEAVQMIADDPVITAADVEMTPLTTADVPDMIELVRRTEPGPFRDRTIELGNYVGVRVDGELIAMAGERLRIPGRTEVSAVCTDERFRGRGLAGGARRARHGRHPGAGRQADAARGREQHQCDAALRSPRVPVHEPVRRDRAPATGVIT